MMNKMFQIQISLAVLLLFYIACYAEAKWALVIGSEVRETWDAKPNFHPNAMKNIVFAGDEVTPGWRSIDGVFYPPKTQEEEERDAFDEKRAQLVTLPSMKARARMASDWKYKLTGPLASGYPDTSKPLCLTAEGEALTLDEFKAYIQDRDDDGASNQELNNLKSIAKDARKYFRSLKP
jgi:hypothetical protein